MSKNLLLKILSLFLLINFIVSKSQDYSRHIELSLLFYECQRSGPLPKTNRIFWRHDSMLDAGADVGLDLTGGYYDAGDNVKYNFPAASAMTLLAWSGIEFAKGYKSANQFDILLDTVKWGTDYFIKCHPDKDTLYVGVGNGQIDHSFWIAPEYISYDYPSYKIDSSNPGSEVAGETASALAAASILFKDIDSDYSATLLKHAIEIYDLADEHRGDYTKAVPSVQGFYSSFSGFLDELAWGAAWLYRATGEEKYLEKYNKIADAEYAVYDPRKFTECREPISWDDKRSGAYILIAQLTKEEKRVKECYEYCDTILSQPRTKGGLWYDKGLSAWASNRYAANAAAMVAFFANTLSEDDPKKKEYIEFVKSQIDYILGDNPAGVNYVVGAEENSPKSVHHRAASSVYQASSFPKENIYTLYGALAGGPGADDSYKDDRTNYQMNEVALDYNAGFTADLAALVNFGYGVKDTGDILDFDRAWPQKAFTPDLSVEITTNALIISSGSGMLCSSWCVSFKADFVIDGIFQAVAYKKEHPNYIVCNERSSGFLDGKGTEQKAQLLISDSNFVSPTEVEVSCGGFQFSEKPKFIPEYGHSYKVTLPGGKENTKALFEESKCWPSHIC
jgi:hypothetical protein